MRDIAVSAFFSAICARNCATDSDGDIARRNHGETDHDRWVNALPLYAVFGAIGTTCTGGVGLASTQTC